MSKKYLCGEYFAKTDIGKVRISNEDQAKVFSNASGQHLLVVCDGMGGENKGDYASSIAVNMLKEEFLKVNKFHFGFFAYTWIAKVIRKINTQIYNEAIKSSIYHGMGTTLTAVLVLGSQLVISQIGDSRCYLVKDNQLVQITDDQTYVGHLYRTGQITKEEMKTHPQRHVLLYALGDKPYINIDQQYRKYKGERILVCSDGLYNNIDEKTLENIMNNTDSVQQKTNELISIANTNGGSDNIGIVIWECK